MVVVLVVADSCYVVHLAAYFRSMRVGDPMVNSKDALAYRKLGERLILVQGAFIVTLGHRGDLFFNLFHFVGRFDALPVANG